MKTRELRDLTKDEVLARKEEMEKEIFNLKIRQATKQIENPLKIRTIRRELARIRTILHEDEMGKTKLAVKAEVKNA